MPHCIEGWLSQSRVIAALAALLMLSAFTDVARAQPAAVPNVAAVGPSVTCQPTSTTRPQPKLPIGFTEQILYAGCLTQPTAISFNGSKTRVFVAEKGGKVWNCDLATPTCTLFADLGSEVCNDADRGLLGLAVDPQNDGNVYVLYTTRPMTGACSGNVLTGGQLSLLTGSGETKILPPAGSTNQPWCFYYTSHSIGGLVFAADNKTLYVSAGDGASFEQVDYGQLDTACGDGTSVPQGAFRSQGTSPYYDGVILKVTNPGATTQSVAVVANGLRNPFRFARLPGLMTDELYIGNVGWNLWESIDHFIVAGQNFGWPCFEGWDPNNNFGAALQPAYQSTGYCGSVSPASVPKPFYAYAHTSYVTAEDSKGRTCGGKPSGLGPDQNGSVISAIGFTDGTSTTYPLAFNKALYFGDLLRKCIWTMQPPNNTPQTFARGLQGGPVDLKSGPDGDLFYVDLVTSTVRRFTHK
ncbi:PQQ-dependent sugar dehydrogenase [Paraburkholderia mimosarum]|uniref:PQQ-dependent sugar dehydrogenase n=1 Tax=Paraburkholderia mimosarum TaxID=312026 RepID=UPI0004826681|nr:PQQ-dependent sugar dehydrogenase [Paraburkholderia mimosarum]